MDNAGTLTNQLVSYLREADQVECEISAGTLS
jgi:hypothetical protein